jgi:hypothetical protein
MNHHHGVAHQPDAFVGLILYDEVYQRAHTREGE